jgi:hypothetical protein
MPAKVKFCYSVVESEKLQPKEEQILEHITVEDIRSYMKDLLVFLDPQLVHLKRLRIICFASTLILISAIVCNLTINTGKALIISILYGILGSVLVLAIIFGCILGHEFTNKSKIFNQQSQYFLEHKGIGFIGVKTFLGFPSSLIFYSKDEKADVPELNIAKAVHTETAKSVVVPGTVITNDDSKNHQNESKDIDFDKIAPLSGIRIREIKDDSILITIDQEQTCDF